MKNLPKLLMMIIVASLAATSGPLSAAQAEQPSVEQLNQSSYSDAELKKLAEAVVEVERINGAYQPRLEAAKTTEEQNQVREAAFNEMTNVLKQKGITVERYKEILVVAQSNPDVAERIRQHIRNVM